MDDHNISRRKFVSTGALTFAGLAALGLPAFGQSSGQEPVRVGLIGCGSRGCGLAGIVKDLPGVSLVACCDILPAHLQDGLALAVKGAKGYPDHRKLLEDGQVDAVIIATPLFLHYPMAVNALDAGKHIYLEKSLANDISQVLDLVKRVRRSGQVFQVGYQYRYYGLYHRVKEIIRQNWVGKVTHFECQYNQNSNWRRPVDDPKMERAVNWRMYREYCGGPLSELCAHQIDMVNYLLDSHPLKVTGMGGINYWKDGRDTYDNIRTIYEYPDGIKSSVTSILSNGYNGYNIRILGDKATVEIQREKALIYAESTEHLKGTVDGVTGATLLAISQGKPVEIKMDKVPQTQLEPTNYALQGFIQCIRDKTKPVSNIETAKDASLAILIGNKAMDTEAFQTWKPEFDDK
jgi:predicted dehydrogenase